MNKEELLEFLKENLKIKVENIRDSGCDGVRIALVLDGEEIDSDQIYF